MAYQFGILFYVTIAATLALSHVALAVLRRDAEILTGLLWVGLLAFPLLFISDRLVRLFRDGVPLAPPVFRRSATLGYWLGIPLLYIGHVITLGTLVLLWQLLQQPTQGVPVGLGFGWAVIMYLGGIRLFESSYSHWERESQITVHGDPDSPAAKQVTRSVLVLSAVVVVASLGSLPDDRNGAAPAIPGARVAVEGPDPAASGSIGGAAVTLNDFLPLAGGGWLGTQRVRQANDVLKTRRVALDVTLEGGDTVQLDFAARDAGGEEWSSRLLLGPEGRFIDGLSITERIEIPPDRLLVVASTGGVGPVEKRLRIVIAEKEFRFERLIEREAGAFELQGDYVLTRP